MNDRMYNFRNGVRDGIPICLGYIGVSFTFGIMARNTGLTVFQAVLISLTNLTSAGQFAGLGLIGAAGTYFEMAVAQLVINMRYCLMSSALSQKLDEKAPFHHRFLVAFGITDEIFGVSVCREGRLNPYYSYGLMSVAVPGWSFGTFLGILSGNLLPDRIISALSVALYGMFIAVIVPPAKGDRLLAGIILFAMAVSALFAYMPLLSGISAGFRIILLTVLISGAAAILFPVGEVSHER